MSLSPVRISARRSPEIWDQNLSRTSLVFGFISYVDVDTGRYMIASVAAFAAALGTVHHTLRSWMRDHLGIRDADPRKQKRA